MLWSHTNTDHAGCAGSDLFACVFSRLLDLARRRCRAEPDHALPFCQLRKIERQIAHAQAPRAISSSAENQTFDTFYDGEDWAAGELRGALSMFGDVTVG